MQSTTRSSDRPINKHKLKVVQSGANPPVRHVWFQCENCVANLHVERSVMYDLLTNSPNQLVGVGFRVWGECRGK